MIIRLLNYSFFLLIFSLPFVQPIGDIKLYYKTQFTDYIFLISAVLFFAAVLFRRIKPKFNLFYILLSIYLLALTFSTILSINIRLSAVKLLGEIYLIGLAVLSFNLINSFEKFRKVFLIWLAAGSITALVSLISLLLFYFDRSNPLLLYTLSHYGTLPPGNYPRIQSTFLNPNMFCNYLSVTYVLLLASVKLNYINSKVFFILLILIIIACVMTVSPGLGGVFLSIGLWLWLIFKEKGRFLFARLSLIGGIFAAILFFFAVIFTPIPTETSPFYIKVPYLEKRIDPTSRVLAWQTSIQTWAENPFFGKGVGTDVADAKYLNPSGNMETLTDAHQMWLNIAGQTGIVGLAALCFLCVFCFRRAIIFNFDNKKAILQTALGIAFISAFLYQGLSGSYEDARHLWVLIGLLASISENDFSKLSEND